MNTGSVLPGALEVHAVISDVDGVLTDGTVQLSASGHKARSFHVHDGMGAKLLLRAGVRIGWISASFDDGVIRARAESLGIDAVDVGSGDKGERFERICRKLDVAHHRVVYIGDDINDLPAMALAGYTACPRDARPEVRAAVRLVLSAPGGRGAFRELADHVLAHLASSQHAGA